VLDSWCSIAKHFIIIIIITKEYDYGGVMSRGLQGHLTNEIVRRESQRDK